MADENEEKEEPREREDEEVCAMIREKCGACVKGDFCMLDHQQRILCLGPKKK